MYRTISTSTSSDVPLRAHDRYPAATDLIASGVTMIDGEPSSPKLVSVFSGSEASSALIID